jgi:hypothetical protein
MHDMLVAGDIHYHGNASHFNFALNTGRLDELLRDNMVPVSAEHGADAMKLMFKVLLVNECCGHMKNIAGLTTVLVKRKDAPLKGAYWWFNNAIERIRPTEVIAIQFIKEGEEE